MVNIYWNWNSDQKAYFLPYRQSFSVQVANCIRNLSTSWYNKITEWQVNIEVSEQEKLEGKAS